MWKEGQPKTINIYQNLPITFEKEFKGGNYVIQCMLQVKLELEQVADANNFEKLFPNIKENVKQHLEEFFSMVDSIEKLITSLHSAIMSGETDSIKYNIKIKEVTFKEI